MLMCGFASLLLALRFAPCWKVLGQTASSMFAGLFEAKSAAAPAKIATGKKKAKPGTSTESKARPNKAAPPRKGQSNAFTAKGPAETMGSGLSKKQRRKQRQREQKPGADQATECTSTGATGGSAIQRKMAAQLAGAHFRQINEELYTTESADAVELFRKDPGFFEIYHAGFRSQSAHWPVRPIDVLVRWLDEQPASLVVGDLGCGDAQIAASVRQTVHSFDLVANNPRVTACDVANVPLPSAALDVAIFCLALMGTNYVDFLREAHRLLRLRGILKIAEVSSRVEDLPAWFAMLRGLGFDLVAKDTSNTHFVLLDFVKSSRPSQPAEQLDVVPLKPCIYKRR